MAVERFLDMLEARLHRHPAAGQERKLRRMPRKALQRGETIGRGQLANGIHPRMEIERGKPEAALADLGNAQPHFTSHLCQRVLSHCEPPMNGGSLKWVNGSLRCCVG